MKKLVRAKIHIYIAVIVQLALAFLTIHTFVPTAYQFFSKIALLVILALPCIIFKCKNITTVFRFVTVFFAFIPSFNPIVWNELFNSINPFYIDFSRTQSLILLSIFSKELIPLLLFLFAIYLKSGFSVKKWHIFGLVSAAIFGMGILFFPLLSDIFMYISTYLLILLVFYLMEKVFEKYTENHEKLCMWLFTSVLFFRGIYLMLSILKFY